jgi:transposase
MGRAGEVFQLGIDVVLILFGQPADLAQARSVLDAELSGIGGVGRRTGPDEHLSDVDRLRVLPVEARHRVMLGGDGTGLAAADRPGGRRVATASCGDGGRGGRIAGRPSLSQNACRISECDSGLRSWCVAKSYRPVRRDQPFLLPPDMREWLPADHVVWFLLETVDALDTNAFHVGRRLGGVGTAGYDPDMLLALLIYAYCLGVRSSRQIERRCLTDVAFRVLCAQDVPDHATIARFRAEHEDTFAVLFTQVLLVAAEAGLARLGTVAIDGTKIPANASIDANRGQEWLDGQVRQILAEAQRADAAEEAASTAAGSSDDGDGERLPVRLRDRSRRTERIRQAAQEVAEQTRQRERAEREREDAALARRRRSEAGGPVVGRIPDGPHRLAEAQAHLAREITAHQTKLDRHAAILAAGRRPMGRPPVPMEHSTRVLRARRVVQAAIDAKDKTAPAGRHRDATFKHRKPKHLPNVVANTTDPQSRIMPTRKGFLQGYNAQIAVSADQLILAVSLGQSTNDQACFVPMMHAAQNAADRLHASSGNDDHKIGTILADAGYASDANLAASGPNRLIALGKGQDQSTAATSEPAQGPPAADATPRQAMSHRLHTAEGHALYKRRGATVEPAIGNLKRILDRFSRRGLGAASGELQLAATAFNLMKIYRAAAA